MKLGGAASKLTGGFGAALRFDEVGQGTASSPASVNLGNTDFRGFDPSSPLKTELEFAPDNTYAFLKADATGTSWNLGGTEYAASALTPAQAFAVEDSILDYVDPDNSGQPYKGWALLQTGKAFVTADVPAFVDSINRGIQMVDVGGTVYASAGTYNEDVNVNKQVTLKGVQNGVAAPGRSGAESVINSPDGHTELQISTSDVTVDGFTIQGNTNGNVFGAGIYVTPGVSGTHILNDVVQSNIVGMFLANASSTDQAVVQGNLFQNNTNTGPSGGTDIYADNFTAGSVFQNVLITNNTFTNSSFVENSWGVGISNVGTTPFNNISVSFNTVSNSGRGMYFYNSTGVSVDANTVTGATHYAVGVFGDSSGVGEPGNSSISITRNTLDNNGEGVLVEGDGPTALAFTSGTLNIANNFLDNNVIGVDITSDGLAAGVNVDVNENHIAGNTTAGLENDSTVTVDASRNWWGDAAGPTNVGGTGNPVVGANVIISPWLTSGVDADVPQPGFQPSAGLGIDISGASSVNEGSTYTLSLNPSNPNQPSITGWDISWGDGSPTQVVSGDPAAVMHVYADGPNNWTISATAHTTSGDATSNTVAVHVNNVAPTVAISGASSVSEGSSYSLTLGAVSDPGQDTVTSYIVHWGDGNMDTYSSNGVKNHTYADGPNNFTITVDLVDEDGTFIGASTPSSLSVTVNNVAPTIAISGNSSVNEGSPYSLTLGAVTDPGQDTVTSYIVHWGDGNTDTYSTNGIQTHTYADGPNNYNITVDLTDEDGTFTNAANPLSVTVNNVAPTITLVGPSSANQGDVKHYTFTTSDPGVDTFSLVSTSWRRLRHRVERRVRSSGRLGQLRCHVQWASRTQHHDGQCARSGQRRCAEQCLVD